MSFHNSLTGSDIHVSYAFTYANAAARNSATVTSADIGKIALQSDTNNYYILINTTPTWDQLTNQSGSSVTPSVQFRSSSSSAVSSSSFTATSTTLSMALSNSAHKIKVSVAAAARYDSTAANNAYFTIFRDGTTNLGDSSTGLTSIGYSAADQATSEFPLAVLYLDAPGDTASHSYTVYVRSGDAAQILFPGPAAGSTMILEEVI